MAPKRKQTKRKATAKAGKGVKSKPSAKTGPKGGVSKKPAAAPRTDPGIRTRAARAAQATAQAPAGPEEADEEREDDQDDAGAGGEEGQEGGQEEAEDEAGPQGRGTEVSERQVLTLQPLPAPAMARLTRLQWPTVKALKNFSIQSGTSAQHRK